MSSFLVFRNPADFVLIFNLPNRRTDYSEGLIKALIDNPLSVLSSSAATAQVRDDVAQAYLQGFRLLFLVQTGFLLVGLLLSVFVLPNVRLKQSHAS